ncbi:MAG: serpin family protein [Clostridia bacterium]|nr:serpin family protein [Clostridia bacterium]
MKKLFCPLISLFLAATLSFSLSSCAVRISAQELSAGYTRTASAAGEINDAFREAYLAFSASLFRQTYGKEAAVLSPLSALYCLGMIANGTENETKRQVEETLGTDLDTLNKALYAYRTSMFTSSECEVRIADSIWIDSESGLTVKPSFLQTNADWYDAQVYSAPFDGGTVENINNWGKLHTDGMIEKILDEIPADTFMYLINSLLFDAKWENKYEKSDIRSAHFTNADGTKADVEMMYSEEGVYLAWDGAIGFRRPYAGGKYAFVGVLPKEGTKIETFLSELDGAFLSSLLASEEKTSVRVGIPEFSAETKETDLKAPLIAMGIRDLFDEDRADFSAMVEDHGLDVYCDYIKQKVKLDVDRNGTKAAAITWGAMRKESASMEEKSVILDRPFLYMILDSEAGIPLFLGAVTEIG